MSKAIEKQVSKVSTGDENEVRPSFEEQMLEYNNERIKEIRAFHFGAYVTMTVSDLRELTFRLTPTSSITISSNFCYAMLVTCGVWVPGFRPSKTILRQEYKVPIDKINEWLPGSYKSSVSKKPRKS